MDKETGYAAAERRPLDRSVSRGRLRSVRFTAKRTCLGVKLNEAGRSQRQKIIPADAVSSSRAALSIRVFGPSHPHSSRSESSSSTSIYRCRHLMSALTSTRRIHPSRLASPSLPPLIDLLDESLRRDYRQRRR